MNRGFTIVELIVSVVIFVIMTTLIVAKYGTFNQSTLLTDTAYDIALVVRLAQTYGLSVKNSAQAGGTANFALPYGIDFDAGVGDYCGGSTSSNTSLTLFADASPSTADGMCGVSDTSINPYAITRGARISSMCVGSDATTCHQAANAVTRMGVTFVRPNPEAVICGSNGGSATCNYTYAEVNIQGSDGSTRTIVLRQNGQIAVDRSGGASSCASNMGEACESAPNVCGETNTGTILCNGSCSAFPPPYPLGQCQ